MADGAARLPHSACKATAQCGFKQNFASRDVCFKCGRDRARDVMSVVLPKGCGGGELNTASFTLSSQQTPSMS